MRKSQKDPERILMGGLCSTCRTASTCMYLRSACDPILHCEEFEEILCASADQPKECAVSAAEQKQEIAAMENCKFFGLCRNCKHRDTCTFPRPEGGVWHCEEYE